MSKRDVSDEQNERHKKILGAVLKEEGNKYCADCRQRNPTWASVNLGVFVCLTCSGIHRSLGVHISQVRSTNLDTWLPKQVEFVKCMGNIKGNKYWEANLPGSFRRPPGNTPNPELASFIRNKYCEKLYAAKDADTPTIDNYQTHPYVISGEPQPATQGGAPPAKPGLAVPLPTAAAKPAPVVDLLSMDEPAVAVPATAAAPVAASAASDFHSDPFGDFASAPVAASAGKPVTSDWSDFESAPAAPPNVPAAASNTKQNTQTATTAGDAFADSDPFANLAGGVQDLSLQQGTTQASNSSNPAQKTTGASKASADDIMKLYDTPQNRVHVDPLFGPIPMNAPIGGFAPVNGYRAQQMGQVPMPQMGQVPMPQMGAQFMPAGQGFGPNQGAFGVQYAAQHGGYQVPAGQNLQPQGGFPMGYPQPGYGQQPGYGPTPALSVNKPAYGTGFSTTGNRGF